MVEELPRILSYTFSLVKDSLKNEVQRTISWSTGIHSQDGFKSRKNRKNMYICQNFFNVKCQMSVLQFSQVSGNQEKLAKTYKIWTLTSLTLFL